VLVKERGKRSVFLSNCCFLIHAIKIAKFILHCTTYFVAGPKHREALALENPCFRKVPNVG